MSRGAEGFQEYYQNIYGERWPQILAALQEPVAKFAMKNPFGQPMSEFYELDPASVEVAAQVEVGPTDKILDLCASPGGKSLAMIFELANAGADLQNGFLTVNDMSHDRVQRLRRVLGEFLPSQVLEKIRITSHDGSRWGLYEKEIYDKILLDAPCSGERHLLEDAKAMKDWSPQRSKGLQQRQYALLCSAWMALKYGGRLVYSTCSLSPLENQKLIEKFLKRSGEEVQILNSGKQIIPTLDRLSGPMFYAVLQKVPMDKCHS